MRKHFSPKHSPRDMVPRVYALRAAIALSLLSAFILTFTVPSLMMYRCDDTAGHNKQKRRWLSRTTAK